MRMMNAGSSISNGRRHLHIVHETGNKGRPPRLASEMSFQAAKNCCIALDFSIIKEFDSSLSLFFSFSLVFLYRLQALQTIQLSAVMTLQLASEQLRVSFVKLSFLFSAARQAGRQVARQWNTRRSCHIATLSDCHNVVGPSNKSRLKNGRT